MKSLREVLAQVEGKGVAVGHFNISDLITLKAVVASARELNVPVLVGVSEGEREFLGVRQIVAWVKSLREEYDFPICQRRSHPFPRESPGSGKGRL
jgi:fructose-bisphosphate aldolase, class II